MTIISHLPVLYVYVFHLLVLLYVIVFFFFFIMKLFCISTIGFRLLKLSNFITTTRLLILAG